MKKYEINLSSEAMQDLRNLFNVIAFEYKTRQTAIKYIDELFGVINKLKYSAESYQLQNRPYFRKYGLFVYRINYKKMAIIYTVHGNLAVIKRIVPASTIIGNL